MIALVSTLLCLGLILLDSYYTEAHGRPNIHFDLLPPPLPPALQRPKRFHPPPRHGKAFPILMKKGPNYYSNNFHSPPPIKWIEPWPQHSAPPPKWIAEPPPPILHDFPSPPSEHIISEPVHVYDQIHHHPVPQHPTVIIKQIFTQPPMNKELLIGFKKKEKPGLLALFKKIGGLLGH